MPYRTARKIYFSSAKVLNCVLRWVIRPINMLLVLLAGSHGGGRQHIAYEKSLHKLMISHDFLFILCPQMLGEQFTPRHTSQKEWCNCSGVKVSLPSWPPSSRSPLHQESYSPSTSQNTGNQSVIPFIFGLQLPFCTSSTDYWALVFKETK